MLQLQARTVMVASYAAAMPLAGCLLEVDARHRAQLRLHQMLSEIQRCDEVS